MKKKQVQVTVFGPLKDSFPRSFTREVQEGSSCRELLDSLADENPGIALILKSSRIASEEEILQDASPLPAASGVFVLPPSSGG